MTPLHSQVRDNPALLSLPMVLKWHMKNFGKLETSQLIYWGAWASEGSTPEKFYRREDLKRGPGVRRREQVLELQQEKLYFCQLRGKGAALWEPDVGSLK